jgi:tRNA-dihydrouridine synthase
MKYQVIVGNLGTVVDTDDVEEASQVYARYCFLSRKGYGRCAYENVTLFMDGEPEKEMIMEDLMEFMITMPARLHTRNNVKDGVARILQQEYDNCTFEDDAGTALQAALNDIEDYCQYLRNKLTNGE